MLKHYVSENEDPGRLTKKKKRERERTKINLPGKSSRPVVLNLWVATTLATLYSQKYL